jgi:formate dehydrogenase subunit gamma
MGIAAGRVLRFTRTERAVHWVQAITIILLLLTGFGLGLPAVEGLVGHRDLLRQIHLSSAFFYAIAPFAIALGANRASVARDVRAVETWDAEDLQWLVPGSITDPGRFNAGQKLNAIFVAWSTLAFALTGFIMWQNRRFPLDVVSRANTIHTDLAYVALLVFLGHLFLAAIWPNTRDSLAGMVNGTVRADWARAHHGRWEPDSGKNEAPSSREVLLSALRIAAAWFAGLFAARWILFAVGANVTDAVTRWLYDVTAWPGTASTTPGTGVHIMDWPALLYLALLILAWRAADHLSRTSSRQEPAFSADHPSSGGL